MKEKLTKNIGLKILSLLLAVLLWIVILNVDDPVRTETFENIPVTKINEKVLRSIDQVYEVESGDIIDVKVKGKRSVIESLRISDFRAIADLADMSKVKAVPIVVTIPGHEDEIEIVDRSDYTMNLSLENLKKDTFRIEIIEKGNVAEGYYINEKIARPNIIEVSGAESVISKIKEVVVEVNVLNETETIEDVLVPKVYDKNGTLMDSSKLTLNYKEVNVKVNLLKTKTVNLYIDVKGNPYYGYEYVSFDYEPKQIVIAGEQEALDKVQYISGEYNIDNKKEDISDEINIADFIKEDVILIDENQNAVINIDIEQLETKDISFEPSDIELRNVPEGLSATINNNSPMLVKAYGKTDDLIGLTKYALKPYIDLKDSILGTKLVNIQFDTSKSNILITNPTLSITLSEILVE